ncbi:DNA alkylation repair protein [Metabacillus malikii]|uniref:3-methyladenine DNA glycosylase AlkD n=1 Tax=Metabacillus malikii TaxID=1504265 RepID=A0ABT9ZAQ0_9BACI|nr:DNA alkylation repair protein [Metabacillus malikii]MDQ0229329.1 3-methyladenine DNA glycosylase AlkD [Metabacillus malikii]
MGTDWKLSYLQPLIQSYYEHHDEQYAEWSKQYLRNQFEFIGIRTPKRRQLTKNFLENNGLPPKEKLKEVIQALWNMDEREFQKAALDILEKCKRQLKGEDIRWISQLIVEKSWWDTVDVLAPHIIANLFLTYPQYTSQYVESWIEDDNIWLQRSAIISQLFYKEKTDEKLLSHCVLRRANSDEFFVQKAIGWALRQYAKTNPDYVRSFVADNDLKPLSKREALKNLSI